MVRKSGVNNVFSQTYGTITLTSGGQAAGEHGVVLAVTGPSIPAATDVRWAIPRGYPGDAAGSLTGVVDLDGYHYAKGIIDAETTYHATGIFDGTLYHATTGLTTAMVVTGNSWYDGDGSHNGAYATTAATQLADANTLTAKTLNADGTDTTVAFGASNGTAKSGAVYTAGAAAQLVTDKAAVTAAKAGLLETTTLLTIAGTLPQASVLVAAGGTYVDPANADVWHGVAVGVSPRVGTKVGSSISNLTVGNLKSGVTVDDVGPGTFTHTADYVAIADVVDASYVLTGHSNYSGGAAGNLTLPLTTVVLTSAYGGPTTYGVGGTGSTPQATLPAAGDVQSLAAAFGKYGALTTPTRLDCPQADALHFGTPYYGNPASLVDGSLTLPGANYVLTSAWGGPAAYGVNGTGSTPAATLTAGSNVIHTAAAFGAGGSSITPAASTYAEGQSVQLGTDQAAVLSSAAYILSGHSILSQAGMFDLAADEAVASAAGAAIQLTADRVAVAAVAASIKTTVTGLLGTVNGTLNMALYTALTGLCSPNDVLLGVDRYPSDPTPGNCRLPAEARVENAYHYGPSDSLLGSLVGGGAGAVYPVEAHVTTDEANYGPSGNEYHGVLNLGLYQLRPVVGEPIAVDLSNDYGVFDGMEDVTCYPATAPAAGNVWNRGAARAVANARLEKINVVEVEPSAGVYDRADTRIRLPAVLATTIGYTPAIGDVIEDVESAAWVVLAVGKPRFGNSWSCFCRQLLLAGGLCDRVSLLSCSVTNVHGSKVVTHNSIQRQIAARIQPLGETEIVLQQRLGFDVNYVIYTESDLETKFDDLLENEASGVQYEIKTSSRRRIDVLSAYYCRVRP